MLRAVLRAYSCCLLQIGVIATSAPCPPAAVAAVLFRVRSGLWPRTVLVSRPALFPPASICASFICRGRHLFRVSTICSVIYPSVLTKVHGLLLQHTVTTDTIAWQSTDCILLIYDRRIINCCITSNAVPRHRLLR